MTNLVSRTKNIGLIGHVVAGFPSLDECAAIVGVLVDCGASAIEIQIPFSEPIADGPLFLAANQQALLAGMTIDRSLAFISQMAKAHSEVQFVAMTYANVLFRRGTEVMCHALAKAGIQSVICPDWPIDERDDLAGPLKKAGLHWIPLIAPTTTMERAKFLLNQGASFAYVVAREGVTGSRSSISSTLTQRLRELKEQTHLPLAVGFGIQTGDDVAALRNHAQFAIIGSQSLQTYLKTGIAGLRNLWSEFQHATQ